VISAAIAASSSASCAARLVLKAIDRSFKRGLPANASASARLARFGTRKCCAPAAASIWMIEAMFAIALPITVGSRLPVALA